MVSHVPAAPVAADGERPPVRRVPSQRRSRERVERMLAVATELIAQKGSDAVRMSEVAERAGVSIGSLYQYFPDKPSIIRTLAERYNAQGLACVQAELAAVHDEAELREALHRVVDGYYDMFLAEPVMRDLWWATQADKTLRDIDADDVAAHTALLTGVLARLRPDHPRDGLATVAMVTMQLIASAVRLAVEVGPPRGDHVIGTFKRMLPKDLLSVAG